MQTGGCWRHNGSGIYVADEHGHLRQTHVPARIETQGGFIYYYYYEALPVAGNST